MRFYTLDANHKEICDVLRQTGAEVVELADKGKGAPDILINFRGAVGFLEIKTDSSASNFKRSQIKFASETRFNVSFCKTADEARQFAQNPAQRGLTQKQKDKLAAFLIQNPKPKQFSANTIYKLLGMK